VHRHYTRDEAIIGAIIHAFSLQRFTVAELARMARVIRGGLSHYRNEIEATLGETKARRLIGRWLSRKRGLSASPENVLRAILDAAATGSPQPVPYIEAILKNAAGGVRRDGDDWLIPHGTDEYRAHRQHLTIANSPEIYRWPDTLGHVARAKSRWPMRVVSAA
jgi:hypothetical protein